MFTIVDWDYLGMANQYIADGFVMFKDIPDVNEINKPKNLILSKSPNEGEELFRNVRGEAKFYFFHSSFSVDDRSFDLSHR